MQIDDRCRSAVDLLCDPLVANVDRFEAFQSRRVIDELIAMRIVKLVALDAAFRRRHTAVQAIVSIVCSLRGVSAIDAA